ncbi:MAG TPA: hypothetical protein VFR21_06195 [Bradyrhizobium sp.]|nr:hypothetical protein [Bradyrhizobium sp.]
MDSEMPPFSDQLNENIAAHETAQTPRATLLKCFIGFLHCVKTEAVWISCRLLLQRHMIQIKCEPRTSGIDYKVIVILMFGMAFGEVIASLARHSATSDQNVGFHQGCATIVADI